MKGSQPMVDGLPKFDRNDVTGAILAGGQSTRFGSDKALAPMLTTGISFLERACQTVAAVAARVIVVGRQETPQLPGIEAIPDRSPGQGPVGGLTTALSVVTTPYLMVLSCDQPLLESHDLVKLLDAFDSADAAVFASEERQFHPLPCAIRVARARGLINGPSGEAGRPLRALIASLKPQLINPPADTIDRLADVDTLEDFRALWARWAIGQVES
jgi:molybdopterin-guanine dinucleotide biosynthesis protein A